ncbi:MAG: hypothetical protein ACREOU_12430 [Candidatus Eiseniibacteriota bacterium]
MHARIERVGFAILALVFVALFALPVSLARAVPESWREDWCKDENEWSDHGGRACEVREVKLTATRGVLRVEPGQNGGVEVAAGTGPGLVVKARVEARSDTDAKARALLPTIRIVARDGYLSVAPESDLHDEGLTSKELKSVCVSFRIEAPASLNLDLSTTNGPIGVTEMKSKMILASQNGPISLSRVGGEVLAEAQNGPMKVTLTGTRFEGKGLEARTKNGPAKLVLPKDYNATVEYGTLHGPWEGRIEQVSDFRTTRLGKGGPPIAVTTENGPYKLIREDR